MAELDLLLESFRRNARVNTFLLDALTPADLALSDGHGGWTVGHHLEHLANFRVGWLSAMTPRHAEGLTQLNAGNDQRDLNALGQAFSSGDKAAIQAVQTHLQSGEPFADLWNEGTYSSSPAHFLQHTIVHDSHHRGQIMALLRLNGRSKEQMDRLEEHWGIWRE